MAANLIEVLEKTAKTIDKGQADEYEIFGISSTETEIEVFNGNIESLSFSDSSGIGVRVIKGGAAGYAFTSFLDDNQIRECIDKAVSNAQATGSEEQNRLPRHDEYLYQQKVMDTALIHSQDFKNYSTEDKAEAAKELEAITLEKDNRITGISESSYGDSDMTVALVNSNGFRDSYRKNSCHMFVNAISKQGEDTSTGYYFGFGRHLGQIDLENIAENAAKRSVSVLGAKKIRSKKMDILLDPFVGAQFLGVVAGALTADSIQKGKSIFAGMLGKKLFSVDLDIFDDGVMPDGLASGPFDGEGVYKGKTPVFKEGVLHTYLYDTYTARKDDALSTGNAVRFSYRSSPSVGINNFYISPGKRDLGSLLSEIDQGLFVMDIIGLHSGANAITGHISVGAKGICIENGQLTYPAKEITIATDFLSFMKSITGLGDVLRFFPSNGFIGSPALLVRDIMVSGT